MAQAKIFVYRYLESDEEEDEEEDLTGSLEIPRVGDIIFRKEKVWRVAAVLVVPSDDPIPRFRLHLADMSRKEYLN